MHFMAETADLRAPFKRGTLTCSVRCERRRCWLIRAGPGVRRLDQQILKEEVSFLKLEKSTIFHSTSSRGHLSAGQRQAALQSTHVSAEAMRNHSKTFCEPDFENPDHQRIISSLQISPPNYCFEQNPLSVCTKITNYLTLWELRRPERYLKLAGDLI